MDRNHKHSFHGRLWMNIEIYIFDFICSIFLTSKFILFIHPKTLHAHMPIHSEWCFLHLNRFAIVGLLSLLFINHDVKNSVIFIWKVNNMYAFFHSKLSDTWKVKKEKKKEMKLSKKKRKQTSMHFSMINM